MIEDARDFIPKWIAPVELAIAMGKPLIEAENILECFVVWGWAEQEAGKYRLLGSGLEAGTKAGVTVPLHDALSMLEGVRAPQKEG